MGCTSCVLCVVVEVSHLRLLPCLCIPDTPQLESENAALLDKLRQAVGKLREVQAQQQQRASTPSLVSAPLRWSTAHICSPAGVDPPLTNAHLFALVCCLLTLNCWTTLTTSRCHPHAFAYVC
jgi:hypothetical protein